MLAGRPVIATDGGGMPEIVVDGVTGLLVALDNPQEMAQAIVTLYQDRALAERISRQGREEVQKRFRLDRYLSEVEAVYKEFVST
jgi:glycosyltransferase involved in cell wall biosynthesis